ncbi:hypothetical protein HLH14_12315 [Acinetobacter sp. ANC 4282]|jgi:uncharacterized membrane protein|uniref:hypothetical protein n=1 Tax=Acinetobacter terrae TaxID=2731247 RepID=UPI0007D7715D|nr:hypothetical protein [Acinetobacter terrae]NNH16758.1 hypothetical protein [Acinetobacter terrae]OAL85240.1 hypothetical protein AY608_02030 [Acinetobacter terrae]
MTPELLLTIIQSAIGLFTIIIIVMLIHPKWRKRITEPKEDTPIKQRGYGLFYGMEFILYPVFWLFKIIFSIFK